MSDGDCGCKNDKLHRIKGLVGEDEGIDGKLDYRRDDDGVLQISNGWRELYICSPPWGVRLLGCPFPDGVGASKLYLRSKARTSDKPSATRPSRKTIMSYQYARAARRTFSRGRIRSSVRTPATGGGGKALAPGMEDRVAGKGGATPQSISVLGITN
jgi:hypothetical protein